MSANTTKDTKDQVDDTIDIANDTIAKAKEKLIDNQMWFELGMGAVKIIAIIAITYIALRVGNPRSGTYSRSGHVPSQVH